jgi:hypothetical protein
MMAGKWAAMKVVMMVVYLDYMKVELTVACWVEMKAVPF